jgi:outer membrane lipoprotein carrier protein
VKTSAAFLGVLLVVPAGLAQSTTPAAEAAAAKVEQRLKTLTTLQADFEQVYFSQAVSEPLRQKGTFLFRKPDLMRWEYREPEANVFLYRDGVFSFYIPAEKQLIRSRAAKDRYEAEILGFFSGARPLREAYAVEPGQFPDGTEGTLQLRLTPREESDYAYILLEAEAATGLIRRAIFFDWAGTKQEFRFTRLRADARLPRGAFDLRVPADVEVIEETELIKR